MSNLQTLHSAHLSIHSSKVSGCRPRQIPLSSRRVLKSRLNLPKLLRYWLPLLVWMCIIFTASCDPDSARHSSLIFEPWVRWLFPQMSTEHVELLHHLFRKCCHLMEYAVLGLLAWRAIRQPVIGDRRPWRWDEAGLAIVIVFAYAATDEFHQVFVPGRTALVSDVIIDTCGGTVGLIVLWLIGKKLKRW
ncbi:MAG TPA: VanZ family protein [Verrucomicrobiae bacterium]|nr:VanZ family protein [Verrucomicrobiae bacterium]